MPDLALVVTLRVPDELSTRETAALVQRTIAALRYVASVQFVKLWKHGIDVHGADEGAGRWQITLEPR